MITISEPNNLQAKCVLLHCKSELENADQNGSVFVKPYVNCREQGFNLTVYLDNLIGKRRSVSFSECRGRDQIVVYYGVSDNFAFNTYIPDEPTYETAKYFGYGEYVKAARFIVEYLLKGV